MRARKVGLLAAALALACLGSSPDRDSPQVFCVGWGCSGVDNHLVNYAYQVNAQTEPLVELWVGTNDLTPQHYSDVLIPDGWCFDIEPVGMSHSCTIFTPHGGYGTPCWSLTAGRAHWWTDDPALAVEQFTFGFNHPWPAETVGWIAVTYLPDPPQWFTYDESWGEPVGWGHGPVHGPVEPMATCWQHEQCGDTHYCFRVDCDLQSGWCMRRPENCPAQFDPVCGCDGVTYVNACFAAMHSESVDYYGPCCNPCPADVNDDLVVDILDLLSVIAQWGESNVREDINGDGIVDVLDLLEVIVLWGPC